MLFYSLCQYKFDTVDIWQNPQLCVEMKPGLVRWLPDTNQRIEAGHLGNKGIVLRAPKNDDFVFFSIDRVIHKRYTS